MKLVLKVSKDSNESERHQLFCDDKRIASIYPMCECPEDATIERCLIGGDQIVEFMRKAYEAGKRGEEFTVEEVEDDED